MSGDERRVYPRTPVTLVVEYPGAEELAQDYTANLSMGGTFVFTDKDFAVGTPVDFVLSFPGLLQPISIHGIVRWCGDDPDTGGHGVGVEFVNYDEALQNQIIEVLEAVERGDARFVKPQDVRFLLIEDNHHLAHLIEKGLHQFGRSLQFSVDVDVASNGADASQWLDDRSYDVLIVDLYTPMMSGTEFISFVRSDTKWESTPIIAMSGGRGDEREQAIQAGCDRFISKPFRLKDLIAALGELIDNKPS